MFLPNSRIFIFTLALVAASVLAPATHIAYAQQTSSGAEPSSVERQSFYLNDIAWLNEVGTLLFDDLDGDGYFSGISLSLDADTEFASVDVYATIDIQSALSPNGFFDERLHTTQPFTIYGRSLNDEYRVDIDLITNFSPDIYDLQISLVDAYSHEILDRVDAQVFRNLSSLSLESQDNEDVFIAVNNRPVRPGNDGVFVEEFAGSGGPVLLGLFLLALIRRLKRT